MSRIGTAIVMGALSGALGLTGCGGSDSDGVPGTAPSSQKTPTSPGSTDAPTSTPEGLQDNLPEDGNVSLPDAVSVADLRITDVAEGLVLVHEDATFGCVILTYADGALAKRGTFAAFTTENKPSQRPCDVRWSYSSDYSARVGEIYADYVDANNYTQHVAVQEIGEAEEDISGNETLFDPVIGPDDKVYANNAGTPSVMNLDGSDLAEVPRGEPRPTWLGGLMVPADLRAVSNADGSLAVEYLPKVSGAGSGYRIGSIRAGGTSGPDIDGDVVIPSDAEADWPLAWVGEDQFLTSSGGVVHLTRIAQPDGDEKPSLVTEILATLPEQYMVSPDPVNQTVVCEGVAYVTVSVGGTQSLPTEQSVLIGLDLDDGTMTAHASVEDASDPGVQRTTQVVGCLE